MENKPIKQIKTQWPFPLLIYKTNFKYNEVRKASGIAYILLELITKQQSDMLFSEVLLRFGIPTELHYLFGKELAGLIKSEIISSSYSAMYFASVKYFAQIKLNEVSLTAKGKKLFREGAIPTGIEKEKAKDIFFSPVTRQFSIQYNMPYSPLANSFLGENFLDNVDIDISGLEDYLNANTTKIGLKAEERLIYFNVEEPQKMNVRTEDNITLNIYPTYIEFTFATSDERAFFDKYYSTKITECGITMKDKFKFSQLEKVPTLKLEELNNLISVYLPNELEKQAKHPCTIFLNRGNLQIQRENAMCVEQKLSNALLDRICKDAEFALLDKSGCKFYCAANFNMPCKNFDDTIMLPLLVECNTDSNVLKSILESIYDYYSEKNFDEQVARTIIFVVDCLNKPELFDDVVTKKLQNYEKVDDKIEVLLRLHSSFKKHSDWQKYLTKHATSLYKESANEVSIQNVIYKNTILIQLKKILHISDLEYVKNFSENICKTESTEIVYEALASSGFTNMEILSVANVVEIFMNAVIGNKAVVSETLLASEYNVLKVNLWKLNNMLGIKNYSEYTLKDDYNVDDFFDLYSTLQQTSKIVEKYRHFALNEYQTLAKYFSIFEPIHNVLSIERTSALHPEKITKQYIYNYISKGKWKDAICDLFVKLQYDLRKMLQVGREMQANDLINNAATNKFITNEQASHLHQLRLCRNGFLHPERNQIPFDKAMVENWRDIVFSLGGKK